MIEQFTTPTVTQSQIDRVRDWMRIFDQETPDEPCIPSEEIRWLRRNLIMEEYYELVGARTRVTALDALADLRYVILGSVVAYGLNLEPTPAVTNDYAPLVELTQVLIDCQDIAAARRTLLGMLWWLKLTEAGLDFTADQINAAFDEVHRSNLSKAWTYEETRSGIPAECFVRKQFGVDGRCCVVKNFDGKVIKSPSYSPAKLAQIARGES